jgi:hypothetical protein
MQFCPLLFPCIDISTAPWAGGVGGSLQAAEKQRAKEAVMKVEDGSFI